jgi:hypothetical protein
MSLQSYVEGESKAFAGLRGPHVNLQMRAEIRDNTDSIGRASFQPTYMRI